MKIIDSKTGNLREATSGEIYRSIENFCHEQRRMIREYKRRWHYWNDLVQQGTGPFALVHKDIYGDRAEFDPRQMRAAALRDALQVYRMYAGIY